MKKVLSKWGEYLGLGIPGAIMITLEWLCFEYLVIMSGWLSIEHQSAVTIVNEFANTNWAPALGLNLTMSVLIGNSLGANNASLAKKYCKNVIFIGVVAFTI